MLLIQLLKDAIENPSSFPVILVHCPYYVHFFCCSLACYLMVENGDFSESVNWVSYKLINFD